MSMTPELLPCPFGCPDKPILHRVPGLDKMHRVSCVNCDASPHGQFSEAEAIAAWNRRAPMTPRKEGSGIVERLRAKKRTLLTRNGLHGTIEEFRNPDGPAAATHIEAQDADISALREALEKAESIASGEIIGMTLGDQGTEEYAEAFKAGFGSAMGLVRSVLALSRAKASGDGLS